MGGSGGGFRVGGGGGQSRVDCCILTMAFVGLGGLVLGRRDVRKGGGMVCGRGRRVVVRMVDDLNLKRMPIPYPGDEEDILSLELQIQHVEEEEEQRMSMVTEDVGTTSEDVKRAMKGEKQMRDKDYTLRAGEIAVRFTNTPLRKDIIVPSLPGKNLLKLGDSVELKIPRACRTGLCGACTVDMEDPQFPDGVQTIRACQTSVLLPDGCDEMVIDLHRMDPEQQEFSQTLPHDPFERFNELDTKYRAAAPPSTSE